MNKSNKNYIKLLIFAFKPKPSGYTLLESLMALVVVGILITSVAPLLALTTASRVQARRVDQASQALRAYIDGVRGGALPLPQKFVVQNPTADFKGPNYGFAPSTSLGGYTTASDRDPGTLIDSNSNGFNISDPQDLVIQAIRPAATCTPAVPAIPPAAAVPAIFCPRTTPEERNTELTASRKQGFLMAVRVYRADAFANNLVPDQTVQADVFIGSPGSRGKPLASSIAEVFVTGTLSDIGGRATTNP
jgi:prepilin-type N-terminal cleavage/methylation domain-containing protein